MTHRLCPLVLVVAVRVPSPLLVGEKRAEKQQLRGETGSQNIADNRVCLENKTVVKVANVI